MAPERIHLERVHRSFEDAFSHQGFEACTPTDIQNGGPEAATRKRSHNLCSTRRSMMGEWGNLCFTRRSIGRRLGAPPADANTIGVVRHSGKLWNDSRKSPKSSILVQEIDPKRRCCTMRPTCWLMPVSKIDIEIDVGARVQIRA